MHQEATYKFVHYECEVTEKQIRDEVDGGSRGVVYLTESA